MSDIEYEYVEEEEKEAVSYEVIPEDAKPEVVKFLRTEYEEAQMEIAERKIKWDKWRRQRQARPESEKKDFPFPNASNVSVPLTRINLQTLFGKLKAAFMETKPPWTIKAQRDNGKDKEQAEVLTKYFGILANSSSDLGLKKKSNTIFLEGGLIGFSWVKVFWNNVTKTMKTADGESYEGIQKQGPDMVVIPPEDIVYKHQWDELDYLPALFHDIHLPWHEVKKRGYDKVWNNVEDLEHWARDYGNETEQALSDRLGVEISEGDVWDITECYFYWEIDGEYCSLIVTMHIPSGVILKEQYNTLGFLPFEPLSFIPEPYSLEGTGVGLACEHMQDEADAIHNMRNDNMKVANQRVIIARTGGSIKPNEKIFPGKILFTDNPKDDVVPFQLGEVYPSSYQAEQGTFMLAQRATGMNDPMMGFADQTLGSRDTFRGQHLRLQQGHGILNSIMENMVEGFSNLAQKIFYILVMNREQVVANEKKRQRLTDEEIMILDEALSIPPDEIPFRLNFEIKMSDVEQTFESRRQNILSLTQLYAQYSQQVFPLAMQLFGPQGQQMQQQAPELYQYMLSIYIGSTKLIEDVFRLFGEDDTDEYLPDTRKAELIQATLRQITEMMMQFQGGQNAIGFNQGNGREGIGGGQPGAGPVEGKGGAGPAGSF